MGRFTIDDGHNAAWVNIQHHRDSESHRTVVILAHSSPEAAHQFHGAGRLPVWRAVPGTTINRGIDPILYTPWINERGRIGATRKPVVAMK